LSFSSTKIVWVLADLESEEKYTPAVLHFVRYSGNDDFAMFSHVPTTDVHEAIQFRSYKDTAGYLSENRSGLMSPDTTFPREVTITASIERL
jgi:hypothetical protein